MQGSLELAKDLPKVFKCLVCGKTFYDKKHAKRKCCSYGISNKAHKKKYKSSLEVHHIKPFRFFENDYMAANDLENLITLCISCHKKAEYEYYRRHPDVVCRKHRSY